MNEKYIKLLDSQITKLDSEDFDLDAWKGSTKYVLTMIFGSKDAKVDEVEHLKIDYSSWALRDSKSDYKPIESCKKKGREILEIAKDEIELFGVKKTNSSHKLKAALDTDFEKLFDKGITIGKKKELLKKLNKEQLVDVILDLIKE